MALKLLSLSLQPLVSPRAVWNRAAAGAQQVQQFTSPVREFATQSSDEIPLHTGRKRLVVVGTGWGGARLLHDIDPKLFDLTVISQRNHMVFTPLLASTTVGTLDPRSVAVHVTDIQSALFKPQNALYIATAKSVDPDKKIVHATSDDGVNFKVHYDVLALATGSQGSTFGIPGVLEHTHFLRDVQQAEAIRLKLIDNIGKAGIPGRSYEEWQRLLHIVIVGGGPTGVEVAGELTDFINQDLKRLYPERAKAMAVTLIEAREVLGSFDTSLREYAARKLVQRGVHLRKGVVKQVTATQITLTDGEVIPYGLCIWSTGVGPTPFTTSLPFAKTAMGRLAIDKHLRLLTPAKSSSGVEQIYPSTDDVKAPIIGLMTEEAKRTGSPQPTLDVVPNVYALGDCCGSMEKPLPALAQVAEQQGKYLAKVLNAQAAAAKDKTALPAKPTPPEEFIYKSLGAMATVGDYSGVMELNSTTSSRFSVAGWVSWFAWRSAYLTRLGSVQKRLLVAFNWTLTLIFGRDMSRW